MRNRILILASILVIGLSSCKKDQDTDWVGTYNGSAVGALISRVVISKVNEKTIKIELQTPIVGVYYSYVTVVNGSLANSTTVNINEDGTIASFPDTYRFSGNGTRNGNGLTINAQAQSKTNASDIKYFIFSGSK